jgi:hypothetical protein
VELEFSHEQPDGSFIVFRRTGECCRCGECCSTGDPFEGKLGESAIHGACPLLELLPDGLHACTDRQHPYYLNGCNVWPTHPGQIVDYPSCTYRFERVA